MRTILRRRPNRSSDAVDSRWGGAISITGSGNFPPPECDLAAIPQALSHAHRQVTRLRPPPRRGEPSRYVWYCEFGVDNYWPSGGAMATEPWMLELTKPRSGADPGTGYTRSQHGVPVRTNLRYLTAPEYSPHAKVS